MTDNPYQPLNRSHYRLLLIVATIAVIGFFDFMAFWYSADIIGQLFFGRHTADSDRYAYTLAMFAAGYLARPVGGWLLGGYGDRYGRKPAILLSFLGISLFTLIMGLLPTYEQAGALATLFFVLARIGQGMAFGSQLPALWTHVTEHLPAHSIGFGCGVITSATMLGGFLMVVVLELLENSLNPTQMLSIGWRLPFLFGAILGLVVLYHARNLPETAVFLANKGHHQTPLPIAQRWQGLWGVILLSWCLSSLVTVVAILLPDLVQMTFILNNGLLFGSFVVCLGFLVLGCLLFGFLTDRQNAGVVIMLGCFGFVVSFYLLFLDLSGGGPFVLVLMAMTGLLAGVIGAMPAAMASACPTRHRLQTLAVGYNSIYALTAAFTPLLLGFLTYYADFAPVLYLSLVCLLTFFFGFYLRYQPRHQAHTKP